MEENKRLSLDLDLLKQRCEKLELDKEIVFRMQQLAEEALQADNKGLVNFSVELRAALKAAVAISNGGPEVCDLLFHVVSLFTIHTLSQIPFSISQCQ